MTRIALAGAAPELEEKFAHATASAYLSLPLPADDHLDDLYGWFNAPAPEVLVFDARTDEELCLEIAAEVTTKLPQIVVLFFTDQAEAISLSAMRAGVSDLLSAQANVPELQHALTEAGRRAAALASPETTMAPPPPTGRVITVVSAKGGVGKTTISTNVAVALARTWPHSTVIVDLDLQFGDVATVLGLDPEHRLEDVLHSAANEDTIALKSQLTLHESGLFVLPAPANPATADTITSAQVNQLLQVLIQEFPYVVVDTSSGLSDHTLGALDQTTDPLLLTALSVPGIHGLRKVVDTLALLQMFTERYHVIVNFADTREGVSTEDVAQTLGVPVSTTIPTSKRALAAVNTGVTLMESRPKDPLVKALWPLVNHLLPQGMQTPQAAPRAFRRKEA